MRQIHTLASNRFIQVALFLFGIFCISLLAIQPFTLGQIPVNADGLLQLHRVAVTDYSLKVDHPLWIRYSTGIAYGYGAPLFNYFPALSYYPSSWLHTLGLSFVQSWLMMLAVYTMLSGVGMFLLGRIWTGSNIGGWISAIAYIYAPYMLFDSIARGAGSEFAALALFPFALYGFTRLARYGQRIDFAFAVFAYAVFIPLHTLITLHGTAFLAIYCLFLWRTSSNPSRTFLQLLLAGGFAFLMTAFFWMPAILETDAIKLHLIADSLDHIDVTRHLRPLSDILTRPHIADPTQQNQAIPITLSWVQLILSALGLMLAWRDHRKTYRNLMLFLGVVIVGLVFLNTPSSSWIWQNVPLMSYTQFPWRVLGLASVALALTTGVSVWLTWDKLPQNWSKLAVFSAVAITIAIYTIPWTYTLYWDDIELNTIRDVQNFERTTGQLTVSSYSEYLPVSTDASQLDPNRLVERFEQADVIPRLVENSSITIIEQRWTSTSGTLRVRSSQPQTLVFDWLWLDGWIATLDDQHLTTYPSQPEGLVAVDVPQGEFNLHISLQPTTTQSLSVVLSVIGLISALAMSLMWKRAYDTNEIDTPIYEPQLKVVALIIGVGVGLFLFKAAVIDHTSSSFMSRRYSQATENTQITPLANFDNKIDLIDSHIAYDRFSDQILPLELYWALHDEPVVDDYSATIRLLNPEGIIIAEHNIFQIGNIDTSNWLMGAYIKSDIAFELPKHLPPNNSGTPYQLDIVVFERDTFNALRVINAEGNPEYASYEISDISLIQAWFTEVSTYQEDVNADETMSNTIGLYQPLPPTFPESAGVGQEITFDWTWQKTSDNDAHHADFAQIQWRTLDDNIILSSTPIELVKGYTSDNWQVGDVITAHHRLLIPANLPADTYAIGIQLLDSDGELVGEPTILDQSIVISEPVRLLDKPTMSHETSIRWNNGIQLSGYSIDDNLTLIWNTDNTTSTSLRLFVHILDADDHIVAQSDSIPANWTRPTTSWIPEEYIVTSHQFDLSTGDYRVRIGWYDPITGERVTINTSDSYTLETPIIIN